MRPSGGSVGIYVEDNGIGIPAQALQKLGRPFEQVETEFSKSYKGSGLGLAIARSLAELHGGSLRIRSQEGLGTIVLVHLPLSDETGLTGTEATRLEAAERATLHLATAVIATSNAAAHRLTEMHDLPGATVAVPGVDLAPPAEPSPEDRRVEAVEDPDRREALLPAFGEAVEELDQLAVDVRRG